MHKNVPILYYGCNNYRSSSLQCVVLTQNNAAVASVALSHRYNEILGIIILTSMNNLRLSKYPVCSEKKLQ